MAVLLLGLLLSLPLHVLSNHCGSGEFSKFATSLFGDFTKAAQECCQQHDSCYDQFGQEKVKCDEDFKTCLYGHVDTTKGEDGRRYADMFHLSVRMFGESAYQAAQQAAGDPFEGWLQRADKNQSLDEFFLDDDQVELVATLLLNDHRSFLDLVTQRRESLESPLDTLVGLGKQNGFDLRDEVGKILSNKHLQEYSKVASDLFAFEASTKAFFSEPAHESFEGGITAARTLSGSLIQVGELSKSRELVKFGGAIQQGADVLKLAQDFNVLPSFGNMGVTALSSFMPHGAMVASAVSVVSSLFGKKGERGGGTSGGMSTEQMNQILGSIHTLRQEMHEQFETLHLKLQSISSFLEEDRKLVNSRFGRLEVIAVTGFQHLLEQQQWLLLKDLLNLRNDISMNVFPQNEEAYQKAFSVVDFSITQLAYFMNGANIIGVDPADGRVNAHFDLVKYDMNTVAYLAWYCRKYLDVKAYPDMDRVDRGMPNIDIILAAVNAFGALKLHGEMNPELGLMTPDRRKYIADREAEYRQVVNMVQSALSRIRSERAVHKLVGKLKGEVEALYDFVDGESQLHVDTYGHKNHANIFLNIPDISRTIGPHPYEWRGRTYDLHGDYRLSQHYGVTTNLHAWPLPNGWNYGIAVQDLSHGSLPRGKDPPGECGWYCLSTLGGTNEKTGVETREGCQLFDPSAEAHNVGDIGLCIMHNVNAGVVEQRRHTRHRILNDDRYKAKLKIIKTLERLANALMRVAGDASQQIDVAGGVEANIHHLMVNEHGGFRRPAAVDVEHILAPWSATPCPLLDELTNKVDKMLTSIDDLKLLAEDVSAMEAQAGARTSLAIDHLKIAATELTQKSAFISATENNLMWLVAALTSLGSSSSVSTLVSKAETALLKTDRPLFSLVGSAELVKRSAPDGRHTNCLINRGELPHVSSAAGDEWSEIHRLVTDCDADVSALESELSRWSLDYKQLCAVLNTPAGHSFRPLHLAIRLGRPDMIGVLLENDAVVDSETISLFQSSRHKFDSSEVMRVEASLHFYHFLHDLALDVDELYIAKSLSLMSQCEASLATQRSEVLGSREAKFDDVTLLVGETHRGKSTLANACGGVKYRRVPDAFEDHQELDPTSPISERTSTNHRYESETVCPFVVKPSRSGWGVVVDTPGYTYTRGMAWTVGSGVAVQGLADSISSVRAVVMVVEFEDMKGGVVETLRKTCDIVGKMVQSAAGDKSDLSENTILVVNKASAELTPEQVFNHIQRKVLRQVDWPEHAFNVLQRLSIDDIVVVHNPDDAFVSTLQGKVEAMKSVPMHSMDLSRYHTESDRFGAILRRIEKYKSEQQAELRQVQGRVCGVVREVVAMLPTALSAEENVLPPDFVHLSAHSAAPNILYSKLKVLARQGTRLEETRRQLLDFSEFVAAYARQHGGFDVCPDSASGTAEEDSDKAQPNAFDSGRGDGVPADAHHEELQALLTTMKQLEMRSEVADQFLSRVPSSLRVSG